MKSSKLIQNDGVAHIRKNPTGEKERKQKEAYHCDTPKGEIELCLTCPLKECIPENCKRLTRICKNCEHLTFSDCYGECGLGEKGIVTPYDSCRFFQKRKRGKR